MRWVWWPQPMASQTSVYIWKHPWILVEVEISCLERFRNRVGTLNSACDCKTSKNKQIISFSTWYLVRVTVMMHKRKNFQNTHWSKGGLFFFFSLDYLLSPWIIVHSSLVIVLSDVGFSVMLIIEVQPLGKTQTLTFLGHGSRKPLQLEISTVQQYTACSHLFPGLSGTEN